MRRIIIFLIALSSLLFIFGCSKQEKNDSLIEVNVDEKEALSSGAVVYYTLQLTDDKTLKISPGEYFMVGETYYRFENFDELWDEFVKFKEKTRDRGSNV